MPSDAVGTRSYQKFAATIRRRDGWTCRICGARPAKVVDHIVPRHLGGRLRDPSNTRVLCGPCNMVKGGSLMSDDDVRAARGIRPLPSRSSEPSAVITGDYTGRPE